MGVRPEKLLKRAAGVFLSVVVIPLAALLGSVAWRQNRISWLATLSSTTGTVSKIREKTDDDGDIVYQPVVKFQGVLEDSYEVSPLFWASPPAYKKGESVSVLYPPNEPQSAIIDDWTEKWSLVTVALVISSILVGFSIIPSVFCWVISYFV